MGADYRLKNQPDFHFLHQLPINDSLATFQITSTSFYQFPSFPFPPKFACHPNHETCKRSCKKALFFENGFKKKKEKIKTRTHSKTVHIHRNKLPNNYETCLKH